MTAPACVVPGMAPTTTFGDFYFGQPGAMVKLPQPDSGFAAPLHRNEVAHQLADGGMATTRRAQVKRGPWVLAHSETDPDTAEVLISYYTGSRGVGPWALLDPSWRNQLSLGASTMQAAGGINTVWSGHLGASTAPFLRAGVVPPILGSAAVAWLPDAVGSKLVEGTQTATLMVPNTGKAVPYLPDQVAVVSLYAKVEGAGSVTVQLQALGAPAAGWATGGAAVLGTATLLTTSWQRLSVVVPVNSWTQAAGPYLLPALACTAGANVQYVNIANAAITYGTNKLLPWVTGLGVPRVTISDGLPNANTRLWRRSHGITLSEV